MRCLCIAFVTEDSGAEPGSAGRQVLLGVLGCDPLDAISGKGTPCQVRVSASCTLGRAGQAVVARGDAAQGDWLLCRVPCCCGPKARGCDPSQRQL